MDAAVVSGLCELSHNDMILRLLRELGLKMPDGGNLVYTGSLGAPQLEMIAGADRPSRRRGPRSCAAARRPRWTSLTKSH